MAQPIQRVAFIGLGVMGYPMAGHLLAAGFSVTVYNRTTEKAQQWCKQYQQPYTQIASTPKAAATHADVVLSCVGNDDDLRQIGYGDDGILTGLKSGAIWLDHTTTSAHVAQELALVCQQKTATFIDAPVSGGQAGAENGKLTVMLGGNETSINSLQSVLESYSQYYRRIGDVGAGQTAKMANQICIAGVVQGLAEAVHFLQKNDLNVDQVLETLSKGAAQSWQMENRGKTMAQGKYDFGFAVDWMRKDLAIALEQARRSEAQLPLTALVDQFYAQVQQLGGKRWDTSSLLVRLQK